MWETSSGRLITGSMVSEALSQAFGADEIWEIAFFDVPSGTESPDSLTVLRDALDQGSVQIANGELCIALVGAPQVWVLDMRLVANNDVLLYIEDGMVFEVTFGSPEATWMSD